MKSREHRLAGEIVDESEIWGGSVAFVGLRR
jgi:hypothetical protein